MPCDTRDDDHIMCVPCPDCTQECEIRLTLPKNGEIVHYTTCGRCKDHTTIRVTTRTTLQMTLSPPVVTPVVIRRPRQ